MLSDMLKELALARKRAEVEKKALADLRKEFEGREDVRTAQEQSATAVAHEANKDKHPHALVIKSQKVTTILDIGAAITWCRSNFTPALDLNKKVFETAVKAGAIPAELATVKEEPAVYVATDLSRLLDAETGEGV